MPVTTSPEPRVVKVSSLDDIVAAVPHMLGFHPRDSVVAVALKGPRERMSFSIRIDLLEPEHDDKVVGCISDALDRADADSALVFIYTDGPDSDLAEGELPRLGLVEALMRGLSVPVRDAVLVAGGRIWSYVCADPDCCPPQGRPLDPTSPGALSLAAAHALEGRAVLADRDTVVRSLAPLGGIAAVGLRQAYDRAEPALLELGFDEIRAKTGEWVDELVERYRTPPATMTADEAARVVLGLHHILARDDLLMRVGGDDDDAVRLMLTDLARRALPPDDAPALTCLAVSAYAVGDGLRAQLALDRALMTDPDYTMAQLTAQLLGGQVPPSEIRQMTAELRDLATPQLRSRRRR